MPGSIGTEDGECENGAAADNPVSIGYALDDGDGALRAIAGGVDLISFISLSSISS